MIKSFKDDETRKIFSRQFSRKLPQQIQRMAKMKLDGLNAAVELADLRLPSANQLEALKDDRKGQHSIRINNQWRICFAWSHGDAIDVEITDYH